MSSPQFQILECVINISEGRDQPVIDAVSGSAGAVLLDVHSDPDHNRSVLTLGGPAAGVEGVEAAARSVAEMAVALIDITVHSGVHPRLGALDVVPWVSLGVNGVNGAGQIGNGPMGPARSARDRFASWAAEELRLPCFVYGVYGVDGEERSLPEVRREAWRPLLPDIGPPAPHPTAGAAAVGARPVLVAYNLWLAEPDLDLARRVAREIRGPHLRALGLLVGSGSHAQVSCNLIDPWVLGPGAVYDAVASRAGVERAELVGLVPAQVLGVEPQHRWAELGLEASKTIEARLRQAGLDGGRFEWHSDS